MARQAGFFPPAVPVCAERATAINAQVERRPTPTRDSSSSCEGGEKRKKKWFLSLEGNHCCSVI